MKQLFWEPKFIGKRFEENTIPLESLSDLSYLKEILDAVAIDNFKTTKHRQRISRYFGKNISIGLGGINEGSAIAAIYFISHSALSAPEFGNYANAKESIIECVHQASINKPITAIKKEFLILFDKFGRSLKDNESIQLRQEKDDIPAVVYNQKTRERLVKESQSPSFMTKKISIKGNFVEINITNNTYGFTTLEGKKITSVIPEDSNYDFINLVRQTRDDAAFFLLDGIGTFKNDKLSCISEISKIEPLDDLDISVRLSELSTLKQGWLDGEGEPLSRDFIAWLDNCFENYYSSTIPLPHLFPMPNGGISAEWFEKDKICRCDIALEINPDHTGIIYSDEQEDGIAIDFNEKGWEQVSNYVSSLSQGVCDE